MDTTASPQPAPAAAPISTPINAPINAGPARPMPAPARPRVAKPASATVAKARPGLRVLDYAVVALTALTACSLALEYGAREDSRVRELAPIAIALD